MKIDKITIEKVLLLIALCLLTSCRTIYTSSEIEVNPVIHITSATQGNNRSVTVGVVDERSSLSLGKRSYLHGSGELTISQNLVEVIRNAVIEGLNGKGFESSRAPEGSSSNLRIELREYEYVPSEGLISEGANIRAVIKAEAKRNWKSYSKIYSVDKNVSYLVLPADKTIRNWLNEVLGGVLSKLLEDQEMLECLGIEKE